MLDIRSERILASDELPKLRNFLHPATMLGNAEFNSEYDGGSTWAWVEFQYDRRRHGGYFEDSSVVVRESRYKFTIEKNGGGTLFLEDGNGRFVESATYDCATLPNR